MRLMSCGAVPVAEEIEHQVTNANSAGWSYGHAGGGGYGDGEGGKREALIGAGFGMGLPRYGSSLVGGGSWGGRQFPGDSCDLNVCTLFAYDYFQYYMLTFSEHKDE